MLLEPISKFDVNYLVTDTLARSEEDCKEFVDILYEKTQGNPFFVKEVFKKAMQLLPDNAWEDNYQNCKSLFDKIPVVHTQLRQKATEGKGDEAFRIGFQILNELGITMPNPFDAGEVNNAFFR